MEKKARAKVSGGGTERSPSRGGTEPNFAGGVRKGPGESEVSLPAIGESVWVQLAVPSDEARPEMGSVRCERPRRATQALPPEVQYILTRYICARLAFPFHGSQAVRSG
jgi:hypothetical protein